MQQATHENFSIHQIPTPRYDIQYLSSIRECKKEERNHSFPLAISPLSESPFI
jgi:hypothetical protein